MLMRGRNLADKSFRKDARLFETERIASMELVTVVLLALMMLGLGAVANDNPTERGSRERAQRDF